MSSKAVIGLSLIALLAAACAAKPMKVPGDILGMDADILTATERTNASGAMVNEAFTLAPYKVKDVDRDWNTTKTIAAASYSTEKTTSGYAFNFVTEDGEAKGSCQILGKSKGVDLGGGMSLSKTQSSIGCACDFGGRTVETVLKANDTTKYGGTFTTSEGSYTISAIYEVEGGMSSGNPSGFRVDGETAQAAVDVTHPGKIWLHKSLSQTARDEVSCLFTGLMLYKPSNKI